jgi:L-asparaginase/Glu-tRNA(Gln) amidotransferase subunit D
MDTASDQDQDWRRAPCESSVLVIIASHSMPSPGAGGGLSGEGEPTGVDSLKKLLGLGSPFLPQTHIIELPVLLEWDEGHTHTDRHAAHWVQLAKCLEANYLKHDGFVVWGALDQAPYTATALSFMLENLGKTVIFTGCQISFAHALADGMKNLFASVMLAGTVEVPEVCIFDNNKLFRANRCRLGNSAAAARYPQSAMSHADEQEGGPQIVAREPRILSPNMKPLAVINSHAGQLSFLDRHRLLVPPKVLFISAAVCLSRHLAHFTVSDSLSLAVAASSLVRGRMATLSRAPKGRLRVHCRMEARLVVVKMVPNFDLAPLVRLVSVGLDTCRAIVLELYGTGNAPKLEPKLVEALRMAREKEVVVVVNSQCTRGTVNLHAYATADALMAHGAVAALDMTTEAVCCKLSYLLGKGLAFGQIRAGMQENLRGEITNAMTGLAYQLRARL